MRPIKKDSTDQSVMVRVIDSTDGTPETSVAYDTAGVDLWYRREGGLEESITEVTLAAANSAHADGGFIHVSDGYCRLDLPDAAVATGANGVMVGGTFTGMIVIGCYAPLVDYDPYDTVDLGLTNLTNHTPQTADNNTILAHADYGLAKLVRSTTPANALDVSVTGEAGLDFANIKDATGAHTLTNITVPVTATVTGKTGFALSSTGADLILKNSTFALALADAISDEVLTGATHNIVDSLGRRIRELWESMVVEEETAQSGTLSKVVLSATANANDDFYNKSQFKIVGGTGKGQTRTFADYNGTTKEAYPCEDFIIAPDHTSKYIITGHACTGVFEMQTGVYDQINAEADLALTDYGANITVPDAAGTAATLHGTTDGKVDDARGRLPAALASGRMSSDAIAISGSTDAADKLEASAETIILGAAATGTLSTTEMTSDLTITVNDQLNGRILIFRADTTTAALRRQATDITASVPTNGKLTFTALTTAPVDGDIFCIV